MRMYGVYMVSTSPTGREQVVKGLRIITPALDEIDYVVSEVSLPQAQLLLKEMNLPGESRLNFFVPGHFSQPSLQPYFSQTKALRFCSVDRSVIAKLERAGALSNPKVLYRHAGQVLRDLQRIVGR